MYREGALHGRILALSTGFFEWRHLPKIGKRGQPLKETEKIPYYITYDNSEEYFFMAAVSRVWHNLEMDQSAPTFAIATTNALGPMLEIHNTKKRMPVILPPELAFEWIQKDCPKNALHKSQPTNAILKNSGLGPLPKTSYMLLIQQKNSIMKTSRPYEHQRQLSHHSPHTHTGRLSHGSSAFL